MTVHETHQPSIFNFRSTLFFPTKFCMFCNKHKKIHVFTHSIQFTESSIYDAMLYNFVRILLKHSTNHSDVLLKFLFMFSPNLVPSSYLLNSFWA